MTSCCICDSSLDEPIYQSQGHASLTTMLQLYDDPTVVWFCDGCGHLQTNEIVSSDDYYARQYSILADSDEEDMLYKVVDDRRIYQVEHRVDTLLNKVSIPRDAKVLDFGCAKGSVLKRLTRNRPDITPYFFDVTDRYQSFWRRISRPEQCAVGNIPASWRGQFDVVCSFYVLEHVADPVATVREIASLLKPGGTFYFLVPNPLANPADVIVADHLQHYSESSLTEALCRAELDVVDIDDTAHEAANIAIGRKNSRLVENTRPTRAPIYDPRIPELRRQYSNTAKMWSDAGQRIQSFEQTAKLNRAACIYGAGFYGNFIASCLQHPESIDCFVDQNSFLHGKSMLGKPIVSPVNLQNSVDVMYVGLNPAVARSVIQNIPAWQNRQFQTFFL